MVNSAPSPAVDARVNDLLCHGMIMLLNITSEELDVFLEQVRVCRQDDTRCLVTLKLHVLGYDDRKHLLCFFHGEVRSTQRGTNSATWVSRDGSVLTYRYCVPTAGTPDDALLDRIARLPLCTVDELREGMA